LGRLREAVDDFDAVRRSLAFLTEPNQTFEIRALHERKYYGMQGFFDDPETAAGYMSRSEREFKGWYFTLNPVQPDLIHRAHNKLRQQVEDLGTKDGEIIRRRWLPIDIDPIRAKGISSTPTEHANALKLAREISDVLELVWGWPDPILASSGNGAHLLYALDLPNTDESRDAIKDFLAALSHQFSTPALDVDPVNFNASRIWKIYGTVSRKGDNTDERPYRAAKILRLPDFKENVSLAAIKDYAAKNPTPKMEARRQEGAESLYSRSYPADEAKWKLLNRAALDHVDKWVPPAFGTAARTYHQGYRLSSSALGRDREEDIAVHPWPKGIKDFGEHDQDDPNEGRRTPITLLSELVYDGDKAAAAKWLAGELGMEESEFAKLAAKASQDDYDEVFKGQASASKSFNQKSFVSAANLMQMKFKELRWLIKDMLPEGAYFLSSRPKMRKTWWALQLSLCTATGGEILGREVEKGDVLFLGLEDNLRRMNRRIELLYTFKDVPDLSGLTIWTPGGADFQDTFPRGADGCEIIRGWLQDHPNARLVVIDTFAHFRGHETGRTQNIYQMDYEAVMPITRLAAEFGVTILIVHHERKGSLKETQDFIEDTSGSTGLTGGVDGVIGIKGKRGPSDENETRQLVLTGRDVPHDYTINMAFDAELGGWRVAQQQDAAQLIVELLRKYPVLKVTEINGLLPNITPSRIRTLLVELRREGKVENSADGYRLVFGVK
jgi:hypothetical protein